MLLSSFWGVSDIGGNMVAESRLDSQALRNWYVPSHTIVDNIAAILRCLFGLTLTQLWTPGQAMSKTRIVALCRHSGNL